MPSRAITAPHRAIPQPIRQPNRHRPYKATTVTGSPTRPRRYRHPTPRQRGLSSPLISLRQMPIRPRRRRMANRHRRASIQYRPDSMATRRNSPGTPPHSDPFRLRPRRRLRPPPHSIRLPGRHASRTKFHIIRLPRPWHPSTGAASPALTPMDSMRVTARARPGFSPPQLPRRMFRRPRQQATCPIPDMAASTHRRPVGLRRR